MNGLSVFAIPAYRSAGHGTEAIASVLAQGPEVRVVVVDDCSDDGSYEALTAIAAAESRVTVLRNDRRLGMPRNWQRAADVALDLYPETAWFAWGSDHDVWDSEWLDTLVAALRTRSDAVLAYPTTVNIGDAGEEVDRWSRPGKPGDAIYGLFRADTIRSCLPVPTVLAFDRVILARATQCGSVIHVDQALWYRRYAVVGGVARKPSIERQKAGFWPDSDPPWWTALPVHWVHGAVLGRDAVRRSKHRTCERMTVAAVARYVAYWSRRKWLRRKDRALRPLFLARHALIHRWRSGRILR